MERLLLPDGTDGAPILTNLVRLPDPNPRPNDPRIYQDPLSFFFKRFVGATRIPRVHMDYYPKDTPFDSDIYYVPIEGAQNLVASIWEKTALGRAGASIGAPGRWSQPFLEASTKAYELGLYHPLRAGGESSPTHYLLVKAPPHKGKTLLTGELLNILENYGQEYGLRRKYLVSESPVTVGRGEEAWVNLINKRGRFARPGLPFYDNFVIDLTASKEIDKKGGRTRKRYELEDPIEVLRSEGVRIFSRDPKPQKVGGRSSSATSAFYDAETKHLAKFANTFLPLHQRIFLVSDADLLRGSPRFREFVASQFADNYLYGHRINIGPAHMFKAINQVEHPLVNLYLDFLDRYNVFNNPEVVTAVIEELS